MLPLPKNQYPKDFYYHRTASPTYREYLHTCKLATFDIDHPPQFAWKKKIFWDFFGIIKYERIDVEPDIAHIKKMTGLKHAFVIWIPYSREKSDIPKGWRRLWLTDHFEETGYSLLSTKTETQQDTKSMSYLASWNDRSKRARKKFHASGATLEKVSPEVFIDWFKHTNVKHWYKGAYIHYYKKMVAIDASKIRQWIAYDPEKKVIGWLAVHDFCDTHSVHLVAFSDRRSYAFQPWTGLIEEWFRESYDMWLKYLSFDQLRNKNGPRDQKGYTEFKENFLSARLSFIEAYFRFF